MHGVKKYICIHGHFYQPPREDAWLGTIAEQETAAPYHDWNERISAECYAPNGSARILDKNGRIESIVNNYASISFNFGPTLLSWMEEYDPEAYQKIIAANKKNNHAVAQIYNHMVMPLANSRDKETGIKWGIADFEKRFQVQPEGMWLSETAVDTETLELLAANGIRFTILAPRQAQQFRKKGDKEWIPVNKEEELVTSHPYQCMLPSGNTIAVFFYNGKLAHDIAFGNLLQSGEAFSSALVSAFDEKNSEPQLIHIATDGETYGHHHKFGDMALASCIQLLKENSDAEIINYSAFLEKFPPEYEVKIKENSSWSCVHGIERWRNDCGCRDGEYPAFNQKWRKPLRDAMDWLRDQAAEVYEQCMQPYCTDPWEIRNAYIAVILNKESNAFFEKYFPGIGDKNAKRKIRSLLEMERHALLMYTSCAWFFDDISRIEPRQVLQYADRVMEIMQLVTGHDILDDFLAILAAAPSNKIEYKNAADLYEKKILPLRINSGLKKFFISPDGDIEEFRLLYADAKKWNIHPDAALLAVPALGKILQMIRLFSANKEISILHQINEILSSLKSMQIEIDPWQIQNEFYALAKNSPGKNSGLDAEMKMVAALLNINL